MKLKQQIVTREQALRKGGRTSSLAQRGHEAERNAKSGQCVECRREATRALAATGYFKECAAAAKVRAQEAEAAARVTKKRRKRSSSMVDEYRPLPDLLLPEPRRRA